MQENRQPIPYRESPEEDIDLLELVQKVWAARKMIFRNLFIGGIIGIIVAFSIPKEFSTSVMLSPESSDGGKMGQLGGMASMLGVNMGGKGGEALSVDLYPDIVSSTPFLLELIDIQVKTKDGKIKTSLFEYLTKEQKVAWWSHVTGFPFKLIGWTINLFQEKNDAKENELNPFDLNPVQEGFIRNLKSKISITTDKKTGAILASTTMQDPLVSAMVMEVVLEKLQHHITNYRTRKAKNDLNFSKKLFEESKESYYKIQRTYAKYVDENRNVVQASYRTEEERLRNEMSLAYGVYNQMAQQLEMNKIKVQEQTPVYTVIEPARIPLRANKPNKPMILIGFIFLSGVASVGWILIKEIIDGFKPKEKNVELIQENNA